MICTKKHTLYQPTIDEWCCPKCGERDDFVIDNDIILNPRYEEEECELLHEKDSINCGRCGKFLTGKTFAKKIQEKHGLIACECCNGTGLVKKQ